MVIASLLLLMGCKQKSGMDLLTDQMSGLKALKSQFVVHKDGEKDVTVTVLYSKPNRILMTSDIFVVALNEEDGHFESIFAERTYDHMPWDGKVYPGTGKLVSRDMINAGPAAANPPSKIVPVVKWSLESKKGGVERYTKTVQSKEGDQIFKLEITDKGVPILFAANDITYNIKSFELVDSIPLETFRVAPKDGFVNHRLQQDVMMIETGMKFDWSKFKAASDVSNFKLAGNTMFVFVDPKEGSSLNAMNWIKQSSPGYRRITISAGNAASGFYDPTGSEISKITSSTPTFVMVNKQGKITGMWLGFDRDNVAEYEKDIQAVLTKKD